MHVGRALFRESLLVSERIGRFLSGKFGMDLNMSITS